MDGKNGLEKDDKDNQINKTVFCMKKKHTDQEPSGKKKVKKLRGIWKEVYKIRSVEEKVDRDLFWFHHKNERHKIKPVVFRANQGMWFLAVTWYYGQ